MDRQQAKAGCLAILRLIEFRISASWMNVKMELFVAKLKKNAFAILATMVSSASWMWMNVSGNVFYVLLKQTFRSFINHFKSRPCSLPNSICINTPGSFRCRCLNGFGGPDCSPLEIEAQTQEAPREEESGISSSEEFIILAGATGLVVAFAGFMIIYGIKALVRYYFQQEQRSLFSGWKRERSWKITTDKLSNFKKSELNRLIYGGKETREFYLKAFHGWRQR